MIYENFTSTKIAEVLNVKKSHVSYYLKRAKKFGYINEVVQDKVKILELTQAGKNFVDQYMTTNHSTNSTPICRLENIRFKAAVYRMPSPETLDWNRVRMNSWAQYGSKVDNVRVHLNNGKSPTIEFYAVSGRWRWSIQTIRHGFIWLYKSCWKAWGYVVYDPVAKAISKHIGQVDVEDIGKVNVSGPRRVGEFEFYDPRAAAEYMDMPKRLSNLEEMVEKILASITRDKNEGTSDESENRQYEI
jgi:DNA-binding MarR family transcriptional regulator